MAEYIEREVALKTLKKSLIFCENELDTGEYRKGCIAAIQDDIGNIKHLPAADVVEIKHGEWNERKIGFCNVCSECKAVVERGTIKMQSGNLNYCPNCGAKMDGEGGLNGKV